LWADTNDNGGEHRAGGEPNCEGSREVASDGSAESSGDLDRFEPFLRGGKECIDGLITRARIAHRAELINLVDCLGDILAVVANAGEFALEGEAEDFVYFANA